MVSITKSQKKAEKEEIINNMIYEWDRQPGEPAKALFQSLFYWMPPCDEERLEAVYADVFSFNPCFIGCRL